jgi:hypothetical protein
LTARNYANAKGLPFGVVVLANPEASLKKNGVSYKRAKDFADFLMPMLYCQWWSCERDDKTIRAFKEEQSQTDLPLVVLIALKTLHTSKQNIIAPNQITKNFGSLNPYAFAFYQVEDLNEGYIGAINKLQSKRP